MDPAEAVIDRIEARVRRRLGEPSRHLGPTGQPKASAFVFRRGDAQGVPEPVVQALETRLGGRLPAVYRAFLRRLGRRPLELFRGSDLTDPERPEEYEEILAEMLALNPEFVWPPSAHVILTHQGYHLAYVLADGSHDGPVWSLTEGQPGCLADSFEAYLETEAGYIS
ncbi:SMI1/KNR4 family protein [Deinococcus humi]|uniref:Knr4/Smi1-like domain-containing protein n=1 Tax=Deinococcus humi TaxID=662880 RepID=A0A7W8K090_9DEIO|nr:SMI1/KNR4 family protein [Deinococcus humi]MBB5366113.1 hypothetical protein [Deinococcus humi]GGO41994.1 hypothetical protein GCM10008949_53550 [Deinococcus humi]